MTGFEIFGRYFGYPKCCIEWFNGRAMGLNDFGLTPAQHAVHNDNGFIPCPACANKVHNNELTIDQLITDREHPLPYPEEDRDIFQEFYNTLTDETEEIQDY